MNNGDVHAYASTDPKKNYISLKQIDHPCLLLGSGDSYIYTPPSSFPTQNQPKNGHVKECPQGIQYITPSAPIPRHMPPSFNTNTLQTNRFNQRRLFFLPLCSLSGLFFFLAVFSYIENGLDLFRCQKGSNLASAQESSGVKVNISTFVPERSALPF